MIFGKRGENDYVLRLEKGEEVLEALRVFAAEADIGCASVTGIGATDDAVLGVFDMEKKVYHENAYAVPMEILSLTGNISVKDDEAYVHMHAAVADETGIAKGGHILRMRISLTAEIFVHVLPGELNRKPDEELGINLIQP